MPVNPNPKSWILKFKIHKTTILLHAEPTQPLSELATELLKALKETHPSGRVLGELQDYTIPDSTDGIILGKPVDINDLNAGWEKIESNDVDGGGHKGKGKAAVGTVKSSRAGSGATPQSAGLRDGGIVAVRFASAETSALQEDDNEDLDVLLHNGTLVGNADTAWDVVVPGPPEAVEVADEDILDLDAPKV